jgi:hypothetical protein
MVGVSWSKRYADAAIEALDAIPPAERKPEPAPIEWAAYPDDDSAEPTDAVAVPAGDMKHILSLVDAYYDGRDPIVAALRKRMGMSA